MLYSFSIRNGDGSDREHTEYMSLPNAARAFGDAVIRDLMRDNAVSYSGWSMDVSQSGRMVLTIALGEPLARPGLGAI